MAAIPPKKQPVPQRSTQRYTLGTGFAIRPTATQATQPLLGKTGNVPVYPYIFGTDFDQSNQVSVASISSGVSRTITSTVSFPNISTLKLDPTDGATLKIIPHIWQNPIVAGLLIASVQWQPQALQQSTNQWVPADNLLPGTVYTAFRASFTIGLYAASTIASPSNLNVGAAALLVILPA